jgi:hypothetical protein
VKEYVAAALTHYALQPDWEGSEWLLFTVLQLAQEPNQIPDPNTHNRDRFFDYWLRLHRTVQWELRDMVSRGEAEVDGNGTLYRKC